MKLTRIFPSSTTKLFVFFFALLIFTVQVYPQDALITLQRGYRTGYSDGYMAGYRDTVENLANSPTRHSDYNKADRGYTKQSGDLEIYRNGYQQGFEKGYSTGFSKGNFNAAMPSDLKHRQATTEIAVSTSPAVVQETSISPETTAAIPPPAPPVVETPAPAPPIQNEVRAESASVQQESQPMQAVPIANVAGNDAIVIPVETDLVIELLGDINTNSGKAGDRFQARVVSPNEINGAIIEGRIDKIQKPGRINRRSELQLTFDQIRISDNRWSNMRAILTEVLPLKGDNIKRVDFEGTVEGRSSVRGDIVKVSATTGTGLLIGAIAGGPVGAAVGAAVGAGVGMGVVLTERGKHIYLVKGQQLRVKTVYETQIR